MEKVSYALGLSLASNLKASGIDAIDYTAFVRGAQHFYENLPYEITQEQAHEIINNHFQQAQQQKAGLNYETGKAFLAENSKKEGVITLASGLQYQILTAGSGRTPSAADEVECHYHGMLIDGTVFDSSVERGEPATFGVMQVIGGWVEALQLMPEGSKWRLFIPANLAYGDQGAGATIAPGSTLIFDVELLKII